MRIDILTLFPAMFFGPLQESILKRAQQRGLLSIVIHHIRDYAWDRHQMTDDVPYGGGEGMVMKPEPIFRAVRSILGTVESAQAERTSVQGVKVRRTEVRETSIEGTSVPRTRVPVVLLTPQGRQLTQSVVSALAQQPRLLFICGHYEGVDERIRQHLVTDEISIGDYVLTGGELAAMVVVDAVARFVPGVLGAAEGAHNDSYASGLLEGPQYTRPPVYCGWEVPDVLRSGHHAQIEQWKLVSAVQRTLERRPDLMSTGNAPESNVPNVENCVVSSEPNDV